jgi:DNA mismatch endonuclease, patch repair protein
MMSGIRGKDTQPEMIVRRHLHAAGLRFRLHDRKLPGRPDLVLRRHQAVVFVHGCFWHQHASCRFAVMPKQNRAFWKEKLGRNRDRDRRRVAALEAAGWRVFIVWECELTVRRLDGLLTVWNPSYAADPLDEHLRILLDWADRYRNGECGRGGRLRLVGQAPLAEPRSAAAAPRRDLALQAADREGRRDAPLPDRLPLALRRAPRGHRRRECARRREDEHMPAYYARSAPTSGSASSTSAGSCRTTRRRHRRAEAAAQHALPRPAGLALRRHGRAAAHRHARKDGKQWFPEATSLTEGRLWAQHDAELRGETARMGRELRDNLLGPAVWSALDPATRTFLASAEAVFRSAARRSRLRLLGTGVEYAKAVEAELNALLFAGRPG